MTHNQMNQIKRLEDLIVAILLAKSEVFITTRGRELEFEIDERKIPILKGYIQRNKLNQNIKVLSTSFKMRITQSTVLESILNDWTVDGKVIAVNPGMIRTNMYLLWICLFARKTDHSVVLDTSLEKEQQKTISILFKVYFSSNLNYNGSFFHIKPFHYIVVRSIKDGRPIVETVELNYLLPEKEKVLMRRELVEWGEH